MPYVEMQEESFDFHVKQIIWNLYAGGQEFTVFQVLEKLHATYKIKCNYGDVLGVLEKSVSEKRLIRVVAGEKYKVAPAGS